MLCEPERSLVEQWLAKGNKITRLPDGMRADPFYERQRQRGLLANVIRWTCRFVEDEALEWIMAGQLTTAQARVGVVWQILKKRGEMSAGEIDRVLGIRCAGKPAMEQLIKIGAAERIDAPFLLVRAIGDEAPSWRLFVAHLKRCQCQDWRPGFCCRDVEKIEPRRIEPHERRAA